MEIRNQVFRKIDSITIMLLIRYNYCYPLNFLIFGFPNFVFINYMLFKNILECYDHNVPFKNIIFQIKKEDGEMLKINISNNIYIYINEDYIF